MHIVLGFSCESNKHLPSTAEATLSSSIPIYLSYSYTEMQDSLILNSGRFVVKNVS